MVLIDIPMPKDCYNCIFRKDYDDCLLIKDCSKYVTFEEQYKDCPLREVQE